MEKILRVGFVGCGEVTQVLHLPTLRELPEHFEVTALHDLSRKVMQEVAKPLGTVRLHESTEAIVEDPNVDVVVVANPHPYHAGAALAAMRAGKHVMIEKPVCITRGEADSLLSAEEKYGVVAQVGYMRRHAPAFLEAADVIARRTEPVTLARIHDVIGPNPGFVASTVRVVARAADMSQSILDRTAQKQAESYLGEIGTDKGPLARAYTLLLALGSHDTSALRELFGAPKKVLYAAQRDEGRWVTAALDYGDFVAHMEIGVDKILRYDTFLEVFMPSQVIRVDYESPYVRHQPAKLRTLRSKEPAGSETSTSFPTRNDAFAAEWRDFHKNVCGSEKSKCSIADAVNDVYLARELIQHMGAPSL